MRHLTMIAGLALCLSAAAGASDRNEQGNPEVKQAEPEQQMLECRFQRVTGTRTKAYRICLTEANWRRHMVAAREKLENLRNRDYGGTGVY